MKRRLFLHTAAQTVLLTAVVHGAAAKGGPKPTMNYLTYPLVGGGWIHQFLLAGPQIFPIPSTEYRNKPELQKPILAKFARTETGIGGDAPIEGGTFPGEAGSSAPPPVWRYVATGDDHLIDQPYFFGGSQFVRGWAYVEVVNEGQAEKTVSMRVFTNGPADVWQSDAHVFRTEAFDYVSPRPSEWFALKLQPGANKLLFRRDHIFTLGGPFVLAVQVGDESHQPVGAGFSVRVPVASTDPARRQALEAAFTQVHLSRDNYDADEEIVVRVPPLVQNAGTVQIELVAAGNKTVRTAHWDTGKKQDAVSLGKASGLHEGNYRVVLTGENNRRELRCAIFVQPWNAVPQAGMPFSERRREGLEAAVRVGVARGATPTRKANMWAGSELRGEAAKMELGRWDDLSPKTLINFAEGIERREDGSDFRMLDLVGLYIRYGKNPRFPQECHAPIEHSILHYMYWADEPNRTAMNFFTENHRFAFHVSEILAGQLYPDHVFENNQQTGAWHQAHGEKLALEWLHRRGQYGLEEWDASAYLPADCNILSYLELAQNGALKQMARDMMDKIFLSFALNTFEGVFGTTHGRTSVEYIKGGRIDPVACMVWYGWGVGQLNDHADELAAVACSHYEVPDVIQKIALDRVDALWNRERQGLDPVAHGTDAHGPVDKVTYKTPDFMLCSAQDWKPGSGGYQQHIWQATLGPEAVVFATSPAFLSENGNNRPNFWAGNRTVPRVAQWKDTLIAVYKGRDSDWLPFTHAYFPTWAFDKWHMEKGWAFGQKGDGYVALRCSDNFELIQKGDSAWRELRAPSKQNVWACLMGRKKTDGDFANFQKKVLALPLSFNGLSVEMTTLRGEKLAFGWDGPLQIGGKPQAITGFGHYDSPYCAAPWPSPQITIRHNKETKTLDFTR